MRRNRRICTICGAEMLFTDDYCGPSALVCCETPARRRGKAHGKRRTK